MNKLNPEIVWISSHGEFKHYEPNISKIEFSHKDAISARDFELLVNFNNKRRLLFLNICEGGACTQNGAFCNLGFPNLLVSCNQDVISHLWMVNSHFAYVFGALFAVGISFFDKNFFEAFEYSLKSIYEGKEKILRELDEIHIDLIDLKERINRANVQWTNIIETGSPVYYV